MLQQASNLMSPKKRFTVRKVKNIWLRRLLILILFPILFVIYVAISIGTALVSGLLSFVESFAEEMWTAGEMFQAAKQSWSDTEQCY